MLGAAGDADLRGLVDLQAVLGKKFGFLAELRERLAQFALELGAEKTRLIEFGRHAARDRRARGLGRA